MQRLYIKINSNICQYAEWTNTFEISLDSFFFNDIQHRRGEFVDENFFTHISNLYILFIQQLLKGSSQAPFLSIIYQGRSPEHSERRGN